MNFGVHGCGTGGEPSLLGVRMMDVPVKGGALLSTGSFCEDAYSLGGVAWELRRSGVGPEVSTRSGGSVPSPWGGGVSGVPYGL